MSDEKWEQLETIFHCALNLSDAERAVYLQKECAEDAALISEIESLILSFENESRMFDEPIFELCLDAVNGQNHKNLAGSVIGFYELQEKLGSGGMGDVYKAVDTRLNRRVALKFLSAALENDRAAKRQLVKEAQAVAMLEHPNICAVHGIEQTGEHNFIVMQYIEGGTLGENFGDTPLSLETFKNLARQILIAVAFAHSHGVVHRDLKPGNIMLTNDGSIKVLDFGLAAVIQKSSLFENDLNSKSHLSQEGLIRGTVAYMSPEQLRGEKPDYRSDIFSVGIILYQLIAGQNPFNRQSQAETIAAILSVEPVSLKQIKRDFPDDLNNLIEKCLQKDQENRFQSAAEVLVELDKIEADNLPKPSSKKRAALGLSIVLLLVVFAEFAFFYTADRFSRASNALPAKKSLAVLPISFDPKQADKEYLAEGLTQNVIEKLSALSGLSVAKETFVAHYKGKSVAPQTAGKELNVDAVFAGNIVERENSLFLESKIIRTADGGVLDESEIPIDESDLIALPEKISSRIIGSLQANLTDADLNSLAKKETDNPEAKKLYIKGRYLMSKRGKEDLRNALRYFRDATNLDASYAKAWSGLADTYALLSVPGYAGIISPNSAVKLAKAAAKKSLEIDDQLCEPHVSLGMIKLRYEWDWVGAETDFRTAVACDAESSSAHVGLSNLLLIKERFDEALEESQQAWDLDPFSVSSDITLAAAYYFKRDYQQMNRILSDSLKENPDNPRLHYLLAFELLQTGKISEATEILEKLHQSDKVFAAAPLGYIYGKTGQKEKARAMLAYLEQISKTEYVPAQEKALVYLGLGETDKVFENLNQACAERFPSLPFLTIDPFFDEIKTDARFANIKRCANL